MDSQPRSGRCVECARRIVMSADSADVPEHPRWETNPAAGTCPGSGEPPMPDSIEPKVLPTEDEVVEMYKQATGFSDDIAFQREQQAEHRGPRHERCPSQHPDHSHLRCLRADRQDRHYDGAHFCGQPWPVVDDDYIRWRQQRAV